MVVHGVLASKSFIQLCLDSRVKGCLQPVTILCEPFKHILEIKVCEIKVINALLVPKAQQLFFETTTDLLQSEMCWGHAVKSVW